MEDWITIVICVLAGVSILLAVGGLNAYSATEDQEIEIPNAVTAD